MKTSEIRAGLIACTGRAGCKFGNADTKRAAAGIADWCDPRVPIATPINIHLTGCHHSCAQHYISDIGMIGARVAVGDGDDTVRWFSHLRRRRLRSASRGRAGSVSRRQGGRRARPYRAAAEGLPVASYFAGRDLPDIRAAPRRRSLAQTRRSRGFHMNQITPPPQDRDHSGQRAVLGSAALLAQRILRGAADRRPHAVVGGAGRRRPAGPGRRWRRRRSAVARPDPADRRPHETRARPPLAAADDGGDGAAGLRPSAATIARDYSEAIAGKAEARLNLCVPGGKETARMLKTLHEELEKAPAASAGPAPRRPTLRQPLPLSPAARATIGRGDLRVAPPAQQARLGEGDLARRFRPVRMRPRLRRRRFLRHFCPQRSRPCRPDHCPARRLAYHRGEGPDASRRPASRRYHWRRRRIRCSSCSLSSPRRAAREGARAGAGRGSRRRRRDARRDGGAAEILGVRPHPEAFVEALEPLQPRLYSISSSHNATPGKLSLTVDCVRYVVGKRKRLGLASTFLASESGPATR